MNHLTYVSWVGPDRWATHCHSQMVFSVTRTRMIRLLSPSGTLASRRSVEACLPHSLTISLSTSPSHCLSLYISLSLTPALSLSFLLTISRSPFSLHIYVYNEGVRPPDFALPNFTGKCLVGLGSNAARNETVAMCTHLCVLGLLQWCAGRWTVDVDYTILLNPHSIHAS